MMKIALLALLVLATAAEAQQYQNYEVQPDGMGGYTGTYGNRNFDMTPTPDGWSGQIGGRRPGVLSERPSWRPGNIGATQRNCVVDGNGNAICR